VKTFYYYLFDSIGKVAVGEENGRLTDLHFEKSFMAPEDFKVAETRLHSQVQLQLNEYFDGKRKKFDLPLAPTGTPFQLKCWDALLQVPYGETRSYGDIARAVGSPRGFRAVGMANNRNPIAIVIPCHRIIGSDGSLVGFGGGLDLKKILLRLEQDHALS
jgi:methylated-DNA-[protein]-cysteine S-methyltransferase